MREYGCERGVGTGESAVPSLAEFAGSFRPQNTSVIGCRYKCICENRQEHEGGYGCGC